MTISSSLIDDISDQVLENILILLDDYRIDLTDNCDGEDEDTIKLLLLDRIKTTLRENL